LDECAIVDHERAGKCVAGGEGQGACADFGEAEIPDDGVVDRKAAITLGDADRRVFSCKSDTADGCED